MESIESTGMSAATPQPAGALTNRLSGSEPTLLLVDDEPNIVSSLKRLLRQKRYRILTANSGSEALSLLAGHPVDVIVSDQRMPGMTGVEFLRAVKERHPDTIRIVLSGYTELQSVTDAVNEGAVYKFLIKPWDDIQLISHIDDAFERKRLSDENRSLNDEVRRKNAELALLNRQLQKAAEATTEQLTLSEAILGLTRDVLHHVPVPVLCLDDEDVIVLSNSSADEFFRQQGVILGYAVSSVMPTFLAGLHSTKGNGKCLVDWNGQRYAVIVHRLGSTLQPRGAILSILLQDDHRMTQHAAEGER